MSFSDDLKAKIKDADVEKQLTHLVDEAEHLVGTASTKAGNLAHEKRDDVVGWLDKAAAAVNQKTDGKYATQVEKAREAVLKGVDKVAERRTEEPAAPDAPAPELPTPTDTTDPDPHSPTP